MERSMSLRRTPGVICQCQGGTPVDGGTLSLTTGGFPGPTVESMSALSAARDVYASVTNQTPVCMAWDMLRQAGEAARSSAMSALASSVRLTLTEAVYGFAVRQVAEQYLDVRESGGANRGKEVEEFLSEAGGKAGNSWCAAFVCHCHYEAAALLCGSTACPRTVKAVGMIFDGRTDDNATFSKESVIAGSWTPIAGDVFVMTTKASVRSLDGDKPINLAGHTGLVVKYDAASQVLTTIEGNTDSGGSSNGDGVYVRTDRMTEPANAKSSTKVLWGFMRPRITWF
jgi:hypothetical protein